MPRQEMTDSRAQKQTLEKLASGGLIRSKEWFFDGSSQLKWSGRQELRKVTFVKLGHEVAPLCG